MPPNGAAREASADRSERNGRQDVREVGEGRKERPRAKPVLLSGGNPQIAKGDGDAPVQAYIAAMPGWKRDVGRRLDALIVRTVPGVRKAVKWNSPFYGVEDQGWFLSFHCFTKYVKVAFFRGTSLRPLPPGESKQQGSALPRHPRGRPARRSAARRLGEASQPIARRTNVSGTMTAMKKATSMKKSGANEAKAGASPSRHIDARIKELGDWRGETLARIRSIIKQADPDVVEEWKWRGVPVWEHDGIICTGETYKAVVKMTFAKGASLDDPTDLFNSSLEGNTRRAIDFHQGDKIDEKALKALIREAAALNVRRALPGRNQRALEETTALPRSLAGNAERADEFAARLIVDLDLAPEIIRRTADGDHALLVQPGAHRVRWQAPGSLPCSSSRSPASAYSWGA